MPNIYRQYAVYNDYAVSNVDWGRANARVQQQNLSIEQIHDIVLNNRNASRIFETLTDEQHKQVLLTIIAFFNNQQNVGLANESEYLQRMFTAIGIVNLNVEINPDGNATLAYNRSNTNRTIYVDISIASIRSLFEQNQQTQRQNMPSNLSTIIPVTRTPSQMNSILSSYLNRESISLLEERLAVKDFVEEALYKNVDTLAVEIAKVILKTYDRSNVYFRLFYIDGSKFSYDDFVQALNKAKQLLWNTPAKFNCSIPSREMYQDREEIPFYYDFIDRITSSQSAFRKSNVDVNNRDIQTRFNSFRTDLIVHFMPCVSNVFKLYTKMIIDRNFRIRYSNEGIASYSLTERNNSLSLLPSSLSRQVEQANISFNSYFLNNVGVLPPPQTAISPELGQVIRITNDDMRTITFSLDQTGR